MIAAFADKFAAGTSFFKRAERRAVRAFFRLAARRKTAVLVCALLGFLLPCVYALGVRGLPVPFEHDEFSYLLAADTFAHGRVTNPAHPLWRHFESFHIIVTPTYASKYPPLQSLFLAAGQVLFGHPAFGIWLSVAFFAAALCWMLQAWTRPPWALLGALVMIASIGVTTYWAQNYFGGMAAAGAGALFFGGFRRILKRPQIVPAILMAAGAVLLMNSRPFEGLLAIFPALIILAVWFIRNRTNSFSAKIFKFALPATVICAFGIGAMLFYNLQITGEAFKLPYQLHMEQYYETPNLIFQQPNRRELLGYPRLKYVASLHQYPRRYLVRFPFAVTNMVVRTPVFYLSEILIFPLFLALPPLLRRKWLLFAAGTIFFLLAAMTIAIYWDFYHYTAPAACLFYLLFVESLRRARTLRRGAFRLKARYVLLFAAVFAVAWLAKTRETSLRNYVQPIIPETANAAVFSKEQFAKRLSRTDGQHLVVVRYEPECKLYNYEWVYNSSEIDRQKIVWAQDLGAAENQKLFDYFRDRRAWTIQACGNAAQVASEN